MENKGIYVHEASLIPTLRCNLRCKHCLAFAPYYNESTDFSLQENCDLIDTYFSLADKTENFIIVGGEILLHPNINEIVSKVAKYSNKVNKIVFTTNGTLPIPFELLEILIKIPNLEINLSDYGKNVSVKVDEIQQIMNKHKIPIKTFKYHGDDMHYNGWVDFTDHRYKYLSNKELIIRSKKCGLLNRNRIMMCGGKFYRCLRVMRRVDIGIIPNCELTSLDICENLDEKYKNKLHKLLNAPVTPGCAYCVGKQEGIPHVTPAIQLTNEEINKGVELI